MNSRDKKQIQPQPGKFQINKVILLAAGHFVNDSYNGFVAPLLPLLMTKLGFSLTLAGLLTTIQTTSTSLTQPAFGHIADKMRHPVFVYLGPLLTAIFLSSLGMCPTYGLLALAIVFAGLGTAAFHPQAATLANVASGHRRGLGMSIFVTGGSAGFSLGPLIILPIVSVFGLERTFVAIIPGIIISYLLFRAASGFRREHVSLDHFEQNIYDLKRHRTLLFLLIIVIVRAFVIIGFSTFIPIFLQQKGFSLILAGSALTVLHVCGAIGALSGGSISDRLGRKSVIFASLVLAIPMFYLFLFLDGYIALVFLGIAGIVFFSSIPVNIIMAQELFPEKASTVSSLIMGFGWGIAGLLVTPLGALADAAGVAFALQLLTLVCTFGIVASIPLPKSNIQKPVHI